MRKLCSTFCQQICSHRQVGQCPFPRKERCPAFQFTDWVFHNYPFTQMSIDAERTAIDDLKVTGPGMEVDVGDYSADETERHEVLRESVRVVRKELGQRNSPSVGAIRTDTPEYPKYKTATSAQREGQWYQGQVNSMHRTTAPTNDAHGGPRPAVWEGPRVRIETVDNPNGDGTRVTQYTTARGIYYQTEVDDMATALEEGQVGLAPEEMEDLENMDWDEIVEAWEDAMYVQPAPNAEVDVQQLGQQILHDNPMEGEPDEEAEF